MHSCHSMGQHDFNLKLTFKPIMIKCQYCQYLLLLVEKFAEGQNFNCAIIQQFTGMPEKNQTVLTSVICQLNEMLQKICKKLKFQNGFLRAELELNHFEKTARRARLAAIFSYLE